MATFSLFGDATLTAEAVTRRLGILPSRAVEVGDRISRRSQAARDSSAWLLISSLGIGDGTELAEHLHRLLDDLEPVLIVSAGKCVAACRRPVLR